MARCNCSPMCPVCCNGPCDCTCTDAEKAAHHRKKIGMTMTWEQIVADLRKCATGKLPAHIVARTCGLLADAINAHLTQPAQSVDVAKVREVIAEMRAKGEAADVTVEDWADKLTAALQEPDRG